MSTKIWLGDNAVLRRQVFNLWDCVPLLFIYIGSIGLLDRRVHPISR